ncbi:ATP-binding cassette domain-containing protein [Streptomyces sp. NPDC007088]|uniref:ATP-binding cassette domain-containing protein n=1 Tax=Streptomyces sp. NPDC007088 TaxID=3364773 RepID=UPI00368C17E8
MPFHFVECSFRYSRRIPVLNRLNLEFGSGSCVLLGPHGAGKSTLLGLAASALVPWSGAVRFRGLDASDGRDRAQYRRSVGWLPEETRPIPGLTVREQVAHAGCLRGLTKAESWAGAPRALARSGLAALCAHRTHQLDAEQLRRLGLAQALVHGAEVLLVDEPAAGLSPRQRDRFSGLLAGLGSELPVIVSTERPEDLRQTVSLYDEVVVLEAGLPRYQGPADDYWASLTATAAYDGGSTGRGVYEV